MSGALWGRRRPPVTDSAAITVGRWSPASLADLTRDRRQLADSLHRAGRPAQVDEGAVERLLLVFEEIGSNALRHGRGTVELSVTASGRWWLLAVSDAAPETPPVPAVDRDPARGGLGLYLVGQICAAHGWFVDGDRKIAWARIDYTRAEAPAEVTGHLPRPRRGATHRLGGSAQPAPSGRCRPASD
jgi:hypothetical protein